MDPLEVANRVGGSKRKCIEWLCLNDILSYSDWLLVTLSATVPQKASEAHGEDEWWADIVSRGIKEVTSFISHGYIEVGLATRTRYLC